MHSFQGITVDIVASWVKGIEMTEHSFQVIKVGIVIL